MQQVFRALGYFTIPDGTDVSPFLNATDVQQPGVPWDALGELSIAAGRIAPGVHSWIHVHHVVTQVTYLLAGTLTVRMKDTSATAPYDLRLQAGQAVVTRPGTLFQLRNDGGSVAELLYIVTPSFVFEKDDDTVRYNDAWLVAPTWEDLPARSSDIVALEVTPYEAYASREESIRRLAAKKGHAPAPLADEAVLSLKSTYDYLAPDGSEIRLLVAGQRGGFAHCVLSAGRTSSPVRHRTVEELWYVLEGSGEVWRQRTGEAYRIDSVRAGDSIHIPVDTQFQFRANADTALKLLLATMPPWPGEKEAVAVSGGFAASVA
jgi:mannose-6-phosphate isomerase-like protein (cupin superfamily)